MGAEKENRCSDGWMDGIWIYLMAVLIHLIAEGVAGGAHAGAERGLGVFGDGWWWGALVR